MNLESWQSWLNAPVLKTGKDVSPSGVRIPNSPLQVKKALFQPKLGFFVFKDMPIFLHGQIFCKTILSQADFKLILSTKYFLAWFIQKSETVLIFYPKTRVYLINSYILKSRIYYIYSPNTHKMEENETTKCKRGNTSKQ